jgi:hypothetical protein
MTVENIQVGTVDKILCTTFKSHYLQSFGLGAPGSEACIII